MVAKTALGMGKRRHVEASPSNGPAREEECDRSWARLALRLRAVDRAGDGRQGLRVWRSRWANSVIVVVGRPRSRGRSSVRVAASPSRAVL